MNKVAQYALAPLVLRVALAVVFIYHGMGKLGEANQWGMDWQKPPPPVKDAAAAGDDKDAGEEKKPEVMLGIAQAAVAWGEVLGGVAVVALLGLLGCGGVALTAAWFMFTPATIRPQAQAAQDLPPAAATRPAAEERTKDPPAPPDPRAVAAAQELEVAMRYLQKSAL